MEEIIEDHMKTPFYVNKEYKIQIRGPDECGIGDGM